MKYIAFALAGLFILFANDTFSQKEEDVKYNIARVITSDSSSFFLTYEGRWIKIDTLNKTRSTFHEKSRKDGVITIAHKKAPVKFEFDMNKKMIYKSVDGKKSDYCKFLETFELFKLGAKAQGFREVVGDGQTYHLPRLADVAYGVAGKYKFKMNQTGEITFSNSTFGNPYPGSVKKGLVKKGYVRYVLPYSLPDEYDYLGYNDRKLERIDQRAKKAGVNREQQIFSEIVEKNTKDSLIRVSNNKYAAYQAESKKRTEEVIDQRKNAAKAHIEKGDRAMAAKNYDLAISEYTTAADYQQQHSDEARIKLNKAKKAKQDAIDAEQQRIEAEKQRKEAERLAAIEEAKRKEEERIVAQKAKIAEENKAKEEARLRIPENKFANKDFFRITNQATGEGQALDFTSRSNAEIAPIDAKKLAGYSCEQNYDQYWVIKRVYPKTDDDKSTPKFIIKTEMFDDAYLFGASNGVFMKRHKDFSDPNNYNESNYYWTITLTQNGYHIHNYGLTKANKNAQLYINSDKGSLFISENNTGAPNGIWQFNSIGKQDEICPSFLRRGFPYQIDVIEGKSFGLVKKSSYSGGKCATGNDYYGLGISKKNTQTYFYFFPQADGNCRIYYECEGVTNGLELWDVGIYHIRRHGTNGIEIWSDSKSMILQHIKKDAYGNYDIVYSSKSYSEGPIDCSECVFYLR